MAGSTQSVPTPAVPARTGPTLAQREARLAYLLLAIPVLVILALVILPLGWNILLSFREIRLIELRDVNFFSTDLTLRNYEKVVGGRNFWPLLRTTFIYAFFGTALPILMGLAAAMLARDVFIGRPLFRAAMLLPYIAPVVAVSFVWTVMLNTQYGIVNYWLDELGFQRLSFLSQRSATVNLFGWELEWPVALSMVILFQGWRYFPFAFLFFLARLQSIPEELYEAAKVDGATLTQRFRHITMPELRFVMGTLILLRFIWTFNKFEDVFLLTGGAAGTQILTVDIYNWLFGRSDVGAAAALSIVLALILAVLLFIYFRWFFAEEGA
jgi:multiple sugar transport system permease protein